MVGMLQNATVDGRTEGGRLKGAKGDGRIDGGNADEREG